MQPQPEGKAWSGLVLREVVFNASVVAPVKTKKTINNLCPLLLV